jgi:hypothetical protein
MFATAEKTAKDKVQARMTTLDFDVSIIICYAGLQFTICGCEILKEIAYLHVVPS